MKIKAAAIVFVFIGIVAYAAFSAKREFAPAEDLPREAVVYVEFTDLPAFLQLWEKSELKQKYLESENFNALKQRRLGLKLASRWQEFNEAVGFPLDLETVGGLAEKRAAIGIYDVGKLEFVFIAPVSSEIFTATKFFLNKEQFEEKLLENGTSVFSLDVAADRGRESQKLLFASVKERFVLATSEKLLLQTVNNINGKTNKNRLIDEPSFKSLTENLKPNLVSVWVSQTALNKDYYFKRYWLMPDTNKLKNIRAGIFGISLEEKKVVERRKFLLEKEVNTTKLNPTEMQKMLSFVTSNVSFYRLQTADAKTSVNAIFDCIFDRKIQIAKAEPRNYSPSYSFYDFDDSEERDYEYLDRKFDETIDEAPEDNFKKSKVIEDKSYQSNLQNILQTANPQSVLTLTEPKNLPMPLFAEFRRATVIKTVAPVNQIQLENAVAQAARNRISLSVSDINLTWKTAGENGLSWRELNLPMLGWEICYAQRGENLIVSNSSNLLRETLAHTEDIQDEKVSAFPIDNLTVIHLKNKNKNFDEIFGKLAGENSNDFFLGNVGSLLETISEIKTIEIEKNINSRYQEEKITFNLEQN
ncbi:MAG TPA: hypothetical protein VGP58_16495 [Pyrinomonadaceae bacterium]|nr:hypothetical protein [Pyrinomonadaceae bacterium]